MKSTTIFWIVAGAGVLGLAAWLAGGQPDGQPDDNRDVPAVAAPARPANEPGPQRWFSSVLQAAPSGEDLVAPTPHASPVYGRNGRAVDLGGKNVAHYIAARIAAARGGDVAAAYDVYQAASICAANDDPVADYHDPAERDQFLQERKRVVSLCAGLSAAQVQERLGFLGNAARAGHLGAQVDFYMEGPYGRVVDIAQNPDDPTVKQWKTDALAHLEQAGGQCDHFSLALLSTIYDAGQLTERDMVKSMAYSIAADLPRNKVQTEQQLRSRFGDELNAEQFAGAQQLGAQLARQACPQR